VSRNFLLLTLFLIGTATFIFIVSGIKDQKIARFEAHEYSKKVDEIHHYLKTLIKEKQNTTLTIALNLAKGEEIIEALKRQDSSKVNLHAISMDLREHTNFKNVWFHLVTKEGISLKRSWTDKGEGQLVVGHKHLNAMFANPKVMSHIDIQESDMAFEAIVPIFDHGEFLGVLEVITHFNSITKKLATKGVSTLLLVDQAYKQQINDPFTKTFIQDYYVANLDAKPKLLHYLESKNIISYILASQEKGFYLDKTIGYMQTYYGLNNYENVLLGHFLLFVPLESFDSSPIDEIKETYNLYLFLGVAFLGMFFYLFYSVKHEEADHDYLKKVVVILVVLLIVIVSSIYYLFSQRLTTEIASYKKEQIKQRVIEYELIYNQNHEVADLIFQTHINTQAVKERFETKDREGLYHYLADNYEQFRSTLNIRQLHFHLKDSTSFLRMHRPKKFGDSLRSIRPSVDHVSQYKKAFDGFEEGRIFNGFRYVYPLFNAQNVYLGSVEISVDAYSFIKNYIKNFHHAKVNFLINSDVMEDKVFASEQTNYIPSPIEGFYFDKNVLLKLRQLDKEITSYQKDEVKFLKVANAIEKGEPFSMHFSQAKVLIVGLPIINRLTKEVVGAILIENSDHYIRQKREGFYLFMVVVFIVVSFFMVMIYHELIAKHKTVQLSLKNRIILDSQSTIIIITDGVHIKETNQPLLDFFDYANLQAFKADHNCVCEYFEKEEGKPYLQMRMGELTWLEYILVHLSDEHKVKMHDQEGNEHLFNVEVKPYEPLHGEYIVSFIDVTLIEHTNMMLKERVDAALAENTKQLQLLQEQSKMAAMGEMIGAIAHQWRQPLNELSINIQSLKYDYEDGLVNKGFIDQFIDKSKKTIRFMSQTIDDFRNFFRIDKEKSAFNVRELIDDTIAIQSAQLDNHHIKVSVEGNDFVINGYASEFQQVLLNIITNAKDALLEKGIDEPMITITLHNQSIAIEDNAGGIPETIIERIFEPYFTTKEQGKGTGIGLYMSKMIIEKNMGGYLRVYNRDHGVVFVIDFGVVV
jgi:signal transduction histidine kinase/heme/copper-type cytochrome/quinol oxidase subunit 2